MNPIGVTHAGVVDQLNRLLGRVVGDDAIVRVQNPVEMPEHSMPQPDLALLRPRIDFYKRLQPTADDTLLAIEVADSSLRYDRDMKLPLYAAHGIPEAWLIDVNAARLTVHRDPGPDGYRSVAEPVRMDVIAVCGVECTGRRSVDALRLSPRRARTTIHPTSQTLSASRSSRRPMR